MNAKPNESALGDKMTSRILLVLVAGAALVNAGCSRSVTATVTGVTLFDSRDNSHPSPRDSRWAITNLTVIEGTGRQPPDPPPKCPAMGTIDLVDAQGVTKHFYIPDIHNPASIRLEGPDGDLLVKNGLGLLRALAECGVPTNKLFAPPLEP